MAPFPAEKQWRPTVVGALTYMDIAVIDKGMAENSNAKFMLDVHDAASNFRTRYYLRNLSALHLWVRKYRNFVRRKGHMFVHLTADNQFDAAGLEELAAQDPSFDYSFCAPYAHSQNPAETTIKAWRLRVRAAIKTAQQDPKSKVGTEHWPYISECITDIENMTFSAACPSTRLGRLFIASNRISIYGKFRVAASGTSCIRTCGKMLRLQIGDAKACLWVCTMRPAVSKFSICRQVVFCIGGLRIVSHGSRMKFLIMRTPSERRRPCMEHLGHNFWSRTEVQCLRRQFLRTIYQT
jgi:hypothetical protein